MEFASVSGGPLNEQEAFQAVDNLKKELISFIENKAGPDPRITIAALAEIMIILAVTSIGVDGALAVVTRLTGSIHEIAQQLDSMEWTVDNEPN